ncbi:MAG: 23S rRNA (adenine(2503)-C(2))-methyltransferase RlmN [Sandaracinaceae bacterium]
MPDLAPPLAPPDGALARLPEEWSALLASWGEPSYRGAQVFSWIHRRGVTDPDAMTNLPKALRARLADDGLGPAAEVAVARDAADGTRKLLLRLHDGRSVESVLIPMTSTAPEDLYAPVDPDGDEDDREGSSPVTQCISSQVGCAMGCVFCASGLAGLKRHMTASEIVGQVLLGRDRVGPRQRLRNVVLMGMGEPLHNYDAVARALTLMFHRDGLDLSRRRVTLSTSGLVPQIDRLGRDFAGQVQLAISLHVPDDERRSELMPINRKHPLGELMDALRRYPLPRRRRITIEYTLVKGFNEADRDADLLAGLLRGLRVKVNLIPLNRVPGTPLEPPSWPVVERFQSRLRGRRIPTFVRRRRGDDIAAACGQLALAGEARKVHVPLPTLRG